MQIDSPFAAFTELQAENGLIEAQLNPSSTSTQILDHLPLVRAIARRIHETLPKHVILEDLVHSGVLGLIAAAQRYTKGTGVAFAAFAKHRVRGAILDSLRRSDWAKRDARRAQKQISATTANLRQSLDRTPTESEIAEAMGLSLQKLHQALANSAHATITPLSENEVATTGAATDPAKILADTQRGNFLRQVMRQLTKREREVITLYYKQDMTMREIGLALGINESRVSQLHKAAIARLATALKATGINSTIDI
jgi:RNA polymerase sigma factor FliA